MAAVWASNTETWQPARSRHGGNGYAVEYRIGRVLCDARILNVFEGAAEIQANIVIRGLLGS